MYAVGTNNNTDFLRPVSVAEVEVVAEALFQGQSLALFERSERAWDGVRRRAAVGSMTITRSTAAS